MWNMDNENILFSQCHIWFLLCSICSTQHSEILLSDIKARGVQWKRPGCPQRCSLEAKTKAGLKLHRRIQQSLIFFFRFITPFVLLSFIHFFCNHEYTSMMVGEKWGHTLGKIKVMACSFEPNIHLAWATISCLWPHGIKNVSLTANIFSPDHYPHNYPVEHYACKNILVFFLLKTES